LQKKNKKIDDRSIPWIVFGVVLLAFLFPLSYGTVLQNTLIPFILGLVFVYFSIKKILLFNLSKKWKNTEGEVLYTKVAIDNPYAREMVWSYFPYIKYSFNVKGRIYTSDHVAYYRELRSRPQQIETFLSNLSEPNLTVYYNPQNPKESVLIPDMPLHRKLFWYFFLFIGISSLTISFIGL